MFRTVESCVISMLESEKSVFSIAADYLGGSTLESLELELLKVKAVAECGYFKDLAKGKAFTREATLRSPGKRLAWTLMLGDPAELEAPEAVECGLLNMTLGARSGTGMAGLPRFWPYDALRLPGRCEMSVDCRVYATVELLDLERHGRKCGEGLEG
eukprot:Skav216676  [mRNA]  locus=scaffold91:4152:5305:+ [translate_table: standard]